MFVVYEYYLISDLDAEKQSHWVRLKEFKTLEEAEKYAKKYADLARDTNSGRAYTIVME